MQVGTSELEKGVVKLRDVATRLENIFWQRCLIVFKSLKRKCSTLLLQSWGWGIKGWSGGQRENQADTEPSSRLGLWKESLLKIASYKIYLKIYWNTNFWPEHLLVGAKNIFSGQMINHITLHFSYSFFLLHLLWYMKTIQHEKMITKMSMVSVYTVHNKMYTIHNNTNINPFDP